MNFFVTELPFNGKIETNNLRTLETWIKVLDAFHINIQSILNSNDSFGGNCWLLIPKGKEILKFLTSTNKDLITHLKNKFDNVYCIHEGEIGRWNTFDVKTQIWLYNQFQRSDKIYVSNLEDVKYIKGMFKNKKIGIMRTIMIDDYLDKSKFSLKEDRSIISGPLTEEYWGLSQIIVAKNFECKIDIPPMGQTRMPHDSYQMQNALGVEYINYMSWDDWMYNLSKYKYSVMMMYAVAAGSFALNCAYHSIPCVGDRRADTQRILFPDISVDYYDVQKGSEFAKKLKMDSSFYQEVSEKSKAILLENFSVKNFLNLLEEDVN
jgi:hypothetical protein